MVTVSTDFELFRKGGPAGIVSPYPVLLNWPQHYMYQMYFVPLSRHCVQPRIHIIAVLIDSHGILFINSSN